MSLTVSASKHQKLLCIFQSSLVLRHFSSEQTLSLSPQQQQKDDSIVNEAVQLLQIPDNDWNTAQLNQLLFSDPVPSPRLVFQIARRLPSSSQAFKFLQYLQIKSSSPDTEALSSTFQAIFELASREPNSRKNLYDLYKTSKKWNIPLTINSITLLLRCFGRNGLVEESLILFNELENSLKNTHVRNVLIDLLLRAGRVEDAFEVLDEMLLPEFDCPPNDVTGGMGTVIKLVIFCLN
ncbi:hypothetical protein JCGZ_14331 [Jatropha curcas]|uniref:Pentacotripeptide-repeat region of PRORP domain-containing protein n=1 Tax=Jatropha curcas TaxID=180498 RepID=A0A067K8F3_JATCU|nr:hypothetical protein JCGZ_14331 [Jatropha curcas]